MQTGEELINRSGRVFVSGPDDSSFQGTDDLLLITLVMPKEELSLSIFLSFVLAV